MPTDVPSIQTLSAGELLQWSDHPSHLFESAFDGAIIGTAVRRSGNRVLVYDEERLIELAVERLKEDADSGEEILWEDGAMWVTDGLDVALNRLGALRPLLLAGG